MAAAGHPQGAAAEREMAADETVGIGGGETGGEDGRGGAAKAGEVPGAG